MSQPVETGIKTEKFFSDFDFSFKYSALNFPTNFSFVGIVIGITTNGTTANYLYKNYPKVFDLVNDWDFSLDSPYPAEHNDFRGIRVFDLVMRGLDICTQLDIPKSITICAMNWNFNLSYLETFLKIASKHKSEIRVNTFKPIHGRHYSMLLTSSQYYDGFYYLITRTSQVAIEDPILASLCGVAVRGSPCGTSSMLIHSKTAESTIPVSPYVYLHQFRTGDLLKDDVFDIINSPSFKKMRLRSKLIPSRCKELKCNFKENCRGGCAARAFLISGSLYDLTLTVPK